MFTNSSLREDANVFFTQNKHARMPNIDRRYSTQFIDLLYYLGAEVKITKILNIQNNILIVSELYIKTSFQSKKQVILELLKTKPYLLEEVEKNYFRINWP